MPSAASTPPRPADLSHSVGDAGFRPRPADSQLPRTDEEPRDIVAAELCGDFIVFGAHRRMGAGSFRDGAGLVQGHVSGPQRTPEALLIAVTGASPGPASGLRLADDRRSPLFELAPSLETINAAEPTAFPGVGPRTLPRHGGFQCQLSSFRFRSASFLFSPAWMLWAEHGAETRYPGLPLRVPS